MLTRVSRSALNFLRHEDGPTAVEYAVMLALIIVVCIFAINRIGNNAKTYRCSDFASPYDCLRCGTRVADQVAVLMLNTIVTSTWNGFKSF